MTTGRLWLLGLALAAATAGIFVIAIGDPRHGPRPAPTGHGSDSSSLKAGPKPVATRSGKAVAPSAPAVLDGEIDALDRALTAADADAAQAAARDLRLRLRTEPEALARAVARFLDPATRADLRMALALILGTLPGNAGDAALLRALEQFPTDVALLRCVLLALGAQREPEDEDDVFGLGDRPHGATGPGGLGITVRRVIPDGDVERALATHLRRTEPELRWAAARALGQSLRADSVRGAFLAALSAEASDDVASALGEPLAAWAGSGTDAADRDAVLSTLVERAKEQALDGYRFRLEDEFDRIPLPARERAELVDLATSERPYGVRSFALVALARGAARGGDMAASDARRTLEAVTADADAAVRDLSARWLGTLPYDRGTATRLATLAGKDPAWNVRFSALEAFVATAPKEDALPVLKAAQSDPEPRVAERAGALLKDLDRPK